MKILSVLSLIFLFLSCIHAEMPSESYIVQIPIPKREHGYKNFETLIISTVEEYTIFCRNVEKQKYWNNKESFIDALDNASVDFDSQSVVLIRHTEKSASIEVELGDYYVDTNKLIVNIGRKKPKFLISSMAYYCFALKLKKGVVEEIEIIAEGREPVVIKF